MTQSPGWSTVDIGDSVTMPLLGFGTWQMRGGQAYDAVRVALQTGYRHLDTATMYRNEAEIGRALGDSGVARTDVFVTTKLPPGNAGKERQTITASLRALGTDHVDLWLVHWPPSGRQIVPVWQELLAAKADGLVRTVGVSNYGTRLIDELVRATGVAPAVNQIPWGPSRYDPALLAEMRDRGVNVEGYSPFKNPSLRNPVLVGIADEHGVTPAQVVVRWHIQHRVIVIPKSAHPDRIRSNFEVSGFTLGDDEMARIDALGSHR